MAVSWEFAPTALTSAEYSGAVTAIDEWPPNSTDLIQSTILAPSASDSFEVDFDLSGAPNFDRGLMVVLVHRGTAGNWSVTAQLKIGGVNEGAVQTDILNLNSFRWSFFYFDDADMSAVEADPTNVSVLFTATNTHGSNQRNQVDAVRMFISPFAGAPPIAPGINAADVIQATGMLESFSLWTDGGNIDHLPDLIGGHHYIGSSTLAVFDDDHPITGASAVPNDSQYASRVKDHPQTEFWIATIVETDDPVPTGDDTSQVHTSGFAGDSRYNTLDSFSMHGSCGAGSGGVGGFVFMSDDGNTHFRTDGVDDAGTPIPSATTFLMLFYLDVASADMRFYVTDNEPLTPGHMILDATNPNGANSLGVVGLMNRPDGSRPWGGEWMAHYLMSGSLTEDEAIENANLLGDFYNLFEFSVDSPSPDDSPVESPDDSPVDGDPFPHTCFSRQWRRCC